MTIYSKEQWDTTVSKLNEIFEVPDASLPYLEVIAENDGKLSGEFNSFYGKHHTEELKSHWSNVRKGKYVGEENHFYGKSHSDETLEIIRKKLSTINQGEGNPMYGKKQPSLSTHNKSRKNNPEFSDMYEKISQKLKNSPQVKCTHCEVSGKIGIMKRWHFDRCKYRQE